MSSRSLEDVKGRKTEEPASQASDRTVDNIAEDIDSVLKTLASNNLSTNYDEPNPNQAGMAGTTRTSTAPVGAPSGNNMMNDSELNSNEEDDGIHSDDTIEVEDARFRTCWELFSDEVQPEEGSADMLRGISDYVDPDRESGSLYSMFRQNGPDLMTLHMYSGTKKGRAPVYIPVYKRDEFGNLYKLERDEHERLRYREVGILSGQEIEAGLKMFEDPEAKKDQRKLEDMLQPKT